MTGEKLYSLHKGKKVKLGNDEGIICGYNDDDSLIMAVITGQDGWFLLFQEEYISDEYKNHPKGFLYVNVYSLLKD